MIVRIVRMEFKKEEVANFLALFEERREKIRHYPGCSYLELLQGVAANESVIFTYSHWESEAALDHYRYSDFFGETWDIVKTMLSAKTTAISTQRLYKMD